MFQDTSPHLSISSAAVYLIQQLSLLFNFCKKKKEKKKEFRPCLAYVYKKHISEQPTEQDPKKETQVEQICGSESRSLILHYFLSAV